MATVQDFISDAEIIQMIEQHDAEGWKQLYDKYAAMMFVTILWATNDDILAEEILKSLFLEFKTNPKLLYEKKSLPISILHHTLSTPVKTSRINALITTNSERHESILPILNCLTHQSYAITDVAELLEISEQELRLKLRSEMNLVRHNRGQHKKPPENKKSVIVSIYTS